MSPINSERPLIRFERLDSLAAMYYQIYKSRLLTANRDGADWRVLLNEGYLTERHASPQAAMQDAIRWIESQEAAKAKIGPPTIRQTRAVALKQKLHIDGVGFSTLEGFYDQVSLCIIPGAEWGRNLVGFNDILRGGFGTPEEGFIFCWDNHQISKRNLGYYETARQLKIRLERCQPSLIASVEHCLAEALNNQGPTVFDWLVEIIRRHCDGGDEEADGIELVLQ